MIVRRKGGLTEFIPTPQEKRDGLIRDHALGLLENLHQRLARLERASKLPTDEEEAFTALLARMRADESRNLEPPIPPPADRLTATANPETPDTASPFRGFCRLCAAQSGQARKSLKIKVLNVGFGCSST